MSRIVVAIPARLASTRFPRKLLAPLAGEPVLAHTIRQAQRAKLGPVLVATADDAIAALAASCGAMVARTRADHPNGSSRLAEACAAIEAAIVVNVQGDEPLIAPEAIRAVADALRDDPSAAMATLAAPIASADELRDPHIVKVVCDARSRALYFSRSPIPHDAAPGEALRHLGIYAYRRPFLLEYPRLAPSPLERIERLEQLRALHHGYTIAVRIGPYATVGIDTPDDLVRAEAHLRRREMKPNR